jgi:signal transduction histidine kinase
MLERLQEDTRAKAQFYAAAAHELRTPLAVLSASIEAMLVRPHSVEECTETFADLQTQTQRLIALTESLLLLNRLEMRTDSEAPESIDLEDICARVLQSYATQCSANRLQVQLDFQETSPVEAPPTHVMILIRNLLENAIRYTTNGGTIAVRLQEVLDVPCLRIYNDCLLPENLEMKTLFQPFYRAEGSRSVATGGNGLGLAICRALADANGWDLTLERQSYGLIAQVMFREVR